MIGNFLAIASQSIADMAEAGVGLLIQLARPTLQERNTFQVRHHSGARIGLTINRTSLAALLILLLTALTRDRSGGLAAGTRIL
jgi:hypothetical protein